jgi:outer membrane murein-binding lipoprotein Lpp
MWALFQLPGFPSSAPVWLQWLVSVVLFLLVAGTAGLWLWKTRKQDTQGLHKTTVDDLNAALAAKKLLVEQAEADRDAAKRECEKAREALADLATEYDGVSGINTKLWLEMARLGFQTKFEELTRQLEIAERDNARLGREARDAAALLAEKEGRK